MPVFPFDINNMLGGQVRVLLADLSQTTPPAVATGPKDIFVQQSPYAAAAGYTDVGATRDSFSYARGLESTGWEIQQAQGPVIEQITNLTRRVTVSFAEFRGDLMQILEQAPSVATVAPTTGQGAQKRVGMGKITSLKRYRVGFVAMRDVASGVVTETATAVPPSGKRGRFVVGYGHEASITADESAIELAKGGESAFPLTFNFYPVSSQPDDTAYGNWWLEDAGILT